MRLLHVNSREFKEFFDKDVPPYAIISHRWEEEEVSFKEFKKGLIYNESGQIRSGMNKIRASCDMAQSRNQQWVWIDTCCIDKRSSAELSEAINSMYNWYKKAVECYVYLSDVCWTEHPARLREAEESFRQSRWFTRGWTLQELLAPRDVIFFDQQWKQIGTRGSFHQLISSVTGISLEHLLENDWASASYRNVPAPSACERRKDCRFHSRNEQASIATKMSWASKRETSRVEDVAYCLLGIFGINMPLLYGEGQYAFQRLQQRLLEEYLDDSLHTFHASLINSLSPPFRNYLARSPGDFAEAGGIHNYFQTIQNRDRKMRMRFLGATFSASRLKIPLRWRSYDSHRRILSIPLTCWQCTADGPKNMILRLTVDKQVLYDNDALSDVPFEHSLIQDSEKFFYPFQGRFAVWTPEKEVEICRGDLSEIMGDMAKVTRVILS
ncbi:MAG: hypothetical protein Q9170_004694 [Blastenia crenularia]